MGREKTEGSRKEEVNTRVGTWGGKGMEERLEKREEEGR